MMEFMLRNGYNANQCKMGQNGARVHVPYRTLQRWWRHFQWWGEVPIATRRRRKRAVLAEHAPPDMSMDP